MRRFVIVLCALFLSVGLVAAGDNELTFSGSYVRHDGGDSFWTLAGEVGLAAGRLLVGPAVQVTEGDGQAADRLVVGGVAEVNFGGSGGGPFVGARGLYDLDAEDDADDYQVSGRAGFKFGRGAALVKVYLEQVVSGYDDTGDLLAVAGVGLRF